MARKGGFFVDDTYRRGENDPARLRGEEPNRLDREQVRILHRALVREEFDFDQIVALVEARHHIPDDVRAFARDLIVRGVSPHLRPESRPRGVITREVNTLLDEISFVLVEKKNGFSYARGNNEACPVRNV